MVLARNLSSLLKVLYNPQAFFTHAALLDQAFAHCPIFPTAASRRSLGRVSVPVWAGRPLRPATDRRLGRPLPYQQANQPQAHPIAPGPKVPSFPPWGVCGINPGFPGLSPSIGQIPTCYSPVRHSSPKGRIPKELSSSLPFDLHVLSMPPAFNLSQDQTLQLNSFTILHRNRVNAEVPTPA